MGRAFTSLERVIDLEAKQGYLDKAVVGGIRQFAAFWVEQAREEVSSEEDLALVEQIAEVLMGYSRLPGPEARADAIDNLKKKLKSRPVDEVQPAKKTTPVTKKPAPKTPAKEKAKPLPPKTPPPKPKKEEIEPVEPDPEGLSQPVTALRGVGPKTGDQLMALGVETIWDLLYVFPRRYDDYTLLKPINRLEYGEQVTVIGTVWDTRARRTRNRTLIQSTISDGTGKIQATWFNQPWLANSIKAGTQIVLSGKVDQFLGRPVFQNPDWEPLELEPLRTRRIVPIYPLTKGLAANKIREIIKRVVEKWAAYVPESLPEDIIEKRHFYPLPEAIRQIHFPDSQESLHRARQRLIFDELFLLQMGMLGQRREWQSAPGVPVPADTTLLNRFADSLPYKLTNAQRRVIGEIAADMAKNLPMNRLLQGDVGSGKTVVAASALLLVASAGYQAALMVPTEILAEQHYQGLSELLENFGITVRLLTGSTNEADRNLLAEELLAGTAQVLIGTHALIQENVKFKQLALAIIDEQHRFGVDQRKALRDKGLVWADDSQQPNPHLMVMSATPIPRSLALSVYGDLDLSILDEMPPGRQEIKTRWLRPRERERAYAFVQSQIDQGRQVFVICPLVEETEKTEAKAAVEEYQRLQEEVFPNSKIGLLHGRMKAEEKESAMAAFYEGETDILVATSVIEVGIDVPNSTIMLIEGADRFGLAQLHQFRGRVGRGEHQSYCLLLADSVSDDAEERLSALEQTNDGFLLAEKDLEIRGPGEFLGRRQSGLPELQLASLTDMRMLQMAREEAQNLFEKDPLLELEEHEQLKNKVVAFWESAADIS